MPRKERHLGGHSMKLLGEAEAEQRERRRAAIAEARERAETIERDGVVYRLVQLPPVWPRATRR